MTVQAGCQIPTKSHTPENPSGIMEFLLQYQAGESTVWELEPNIPKETEIYNSDLEGKKKESK